jgi:hypothetical protein
MAINFVDISYAQGNYDMAADPNLMIMMKASGYYTGSLQPYLDAQLVNNYANAKNFGKIPFMYHYFVPAVDAHTQAAYFLEAVSPLTEGDGYALDVEIDGPNLVQDVLTFVTDHHAKTGCWPWIYINRYLRQKYDWSSVFALCSEWIAAPDVSYAGTIPDVGIYVAQQGPIVNGVDTDEYFGTLESLRSYTYGYKPPTQAPPAEAPAPQPEPTPVENTPPAPTPEPSPVAAEPTVPATEPPVLQGAQPTSSGQIDPAENQTSEPNPPVETPEQTQVAPKEAPKVGFWVKVLKFLKGLIW